MLYLNTSSYKIIIIEKLLTFANFILYNLNHKISLTFIIKIGVLQLFTFQTINFKVNIIIIK
jgi:hypothetical protein